MNVDEIPLARVLKRSSSRLLDWLLPPQCLSCGTQNDVPGALCGMCWEQADFITEPQCASCGLPFELSMPEGAVCGACLREPPLYDRARAAMAYDEISRRMILGLKYGDRTDMAPTFAKWMARAGDDLIREADFIVPVPLHWSRMFGRRFNQAALLARLIARDYRRPLAHDLLVRQRNTPSQAGLNARKRRENMRGAFTVKSRWIDRVKGKRVLLVDDVMTTGATVTALARTLKRKGIKDVDVLTIARVVKPLSGGDRNGGS